MSEKENAVTKMYDLVLYLVPILEQFPRSQKFLLADRIEGDALDILQGLVRAYYASQQAKREMLKEINLQLESLRYLIRLSHDLKHISVQRYGHISERVDEVGKMVGGWIKALP